MAVMGLLFPAVLHYTHTEVHSGESELALSRFYSCIMIVTYDAAFLFFQLKSHKNPYDPLNEVGYEFFHSPPPPTQKEKEFRIFQCVNILIPCVLYCILLNFILIHGFLYSLFAI